MDSILISVKEKLESCTRLLKDKLYDEDEDSISLQDFNKLEGIYKDIKKILKSL